MLSHIGCGFCPPRDFQLAEDCRDMILDRLLRNVNVPRNLRVRFAGRQEAQDLILASSKPRELFVSGKHRSLTDTSEDLPSYGWIEGTLALTYVTHRPDYVILSCGV